MNIKEFISSGTLESYVLNLSSEEEKREIELLSLKHPEIKAEIESIEAALNSYAQEHAVTPPAYMKERIMQSLNTGSSETVKKETKVLELYPSSKQSNYMRWSIAASITLLIGSSLTNLYLFNKLGKANQELAQLNSNNAVLADNFNTIKANFDESKSQLDIFNDPSNLAIDLAGLPNKPDAKARVLWNANSKTLYVAVNNLPVPPDSMQYQLWAIKDGQPIDAGMIAFTNDSISIQKMKDIGEAQAFAITLEKKGGSLSPEGEMYVLGKVAI